MNKNKLLKINYIQTEIELLMKSCNKNKKEIKNILKKNILFPNKIITIFITN